MTAWTEVERANLRAYLGFPAIFKQAEPRLESAITAVQSIADGGVMPTSATQDRMRVAMAQIESIDTKLVELHCTLHVDAAGKEGVRLNVRAAMRALKQEGRRFIGQLAISLGTHPIRDYYSGVSTGDTSSASPFDIIDLV